MFKFSLILLSIIILVLLGLDSSIFDEKSIRVETKSIIEVKNEKPTKVQEEYISQNVIVKKEIIKETLKIKKIDKYLELKFLIREAKTANRKGELEKAIAYYNEVIEQSINSKEIKILRLFVIASFQKANLLERDKSIEIYDELIKKFSKSSNVELLKIYALAQFTKSYLTSGVESIEVFNQIIEKFKKEDNSELLMQLYKAQKNKAYVLEEYMNQKEEAIEVYDEIIKKFTPYNGSKYKSIVEDALFSKSFLLMGESDEESMEIYDEIIKKFESENQNSTNMPVPVKIEYAIINNIELSLITNNDDTQYRELAKSFLADSKDTKPQLDMLGILKDAQVSNQDEAMRIWQEEHQEYAFTNWSFIELQRWNNQMEESASKTRIKTYLDEFVKFGSRDNRRILDNR